MDKMTITIAGISGHMGRLIATHILKRSSTATVNGTCRTPSKLPEDLASHPRVKIYQTDLINGREIQDAVRGSNIAIFAALGDFDFMADAQKRVIDACVAEGVPRYMAGDWALDFRKLEYGQLPAKDPMKSVDEYLGQKEKEMDGKLSAVHVLNACFMEVPWRGIYNAKGKTLMYWGNGEDKWELTTYEDAAKYSAAIALDEDAKGWFKVRGDHISVPSMAPLFESAFGFKPELKQLGSLDDLYNMMHGIRAKSPQNIWSWLSMFYMYYSINGQTTLSEPLSHDRYPDIKPTTLREYLGAIGTPEKLGIAFDETEKVKDRV